MSDEVENTAVLAQGACYFTTSHLRTALMLRVPPLSLSFPISCGKPAVPCLSDVLTRGRSQGSIIEVPRHPLLAAAALLYELLPTQQCVIYLRP
ncbi:unnamed protein product [Ectocarpus sp. CCAP 1310/34]|nr:unnamed protein product [Ectocarpus sp. CCAP 1310/34]